MSNNCFPKTDAECNGSGQVDPVKRSLLKEAGADVLIADYRQPDALLERLLSK